jgi:hypothetical protein
MVHHRSDRRVLYQEDFRSSRWLLAGVEEEAPSSCFVDALSFCSSMGRQSLDLIGLLSAPTAPSPTPKYLAVLETTEL